MQTPKNNAAAASVRLRQPMFIFLLNPSVPKTTRGSALSKTHPGCPGMRSWGEGFICLRELCRACGIYGIPNGIANSGWHGLVIRPAETGREIELTRTVTVIADQ